jgi:cell division septation protein DedD
MATKKGKGKPSAPKKKYAFRLTRKGVWLWIFLIFFISTWMFALGILVGRGTAPVRFDIDKLRKELTELKKKTLAVDLRRFKINKNAIEEKPDLAFHEALKSTKEEISLPAGPPEEKKKPPSSKPIQKKKQTVEKKAPPKTVTPGTSGSEPKKETAKPASGRQNGKGMSVQVASVKEGKDADRLIKTLKGKGFSAYRVIAEVPGKGLWFRVRVGPFKNRDEADRSLSRLKKEKFSGFVVNY